MARVVLIAILAAASVSPAAAGVITRPAADRYGPDAPPPAVERPALSPANFLNWPGKASAPAPSAPDLAGAPSPRAAAKTLPRSLYAPSPEPRPPSPAAQPTSTSRASPPSGWRSPDRYAAADGAPPRRYSVAREFGVHPDPTPLPPQFFGPSVDLADPPPPPPPKLSGGQAGSAASQARADAATPVAGDLNSNTGSN